MQLQTRPVGCDFYLVGSNFENDATLSASLILDLSQLLITEIKDFIFLCFAG